jgi:hypothetical protein
MPSDDWRFGARVGCWRGGGDEIPANGDVVGITGRTGFAWAGGGALNNDGKEIGGFEVVDDVVFVSVALWKSSKSSSPPLKSIPFPFPFEVVVATSSLSKLNKSASFFGAATTAGTFSLFEGDFLGIELRWTVAWAPPSSNSSYSSNCALLEGRSWKSLPPEYPVEEEKPPPSPSSYYNVISGVP